MKPQCTKGPSLRLLPYTVRENLPVLGSRQHLAGKAKALVRWFTPDRSVEWYVTEGSVRRNAVGIAVDYLLFGLVTGESKRLEYFWLSEVAGSGPTRLLVERDRRWQPKMLEEIVPGLFPTQEQED